MITRLANQSFLVMFASKYGSKSIQINRLQNFNMMAFSSGKKQKKIEKGQMKRKSYNLDGIDKNKLPEHLKVAFELKKQTQNMEVVSEAQLENEIIVQQIKRQRQQIQSLPSAEELKNITRSQTEKFVFGLSAVNIGIYGFLYLPILSNHMYWLGIYSSIFLYPSLIFTTSISIGVNLAYLILRQGLFMSEKVEEIKKVDITSAPISLYFQMILISLQFFSLATSVSIPLTLLGLNQNYKSLGLYAILFCLLSVNAHFTIQRRLFINRLLHISTQAGCFFALFLLSAFTYVHFNMGDTNQEKQKQDKRNFIRGQNKLKDIWRIQKKIIKKNEKITDQLNLDQTEETQKISEK